jgi:hypothetical protein
MPEHLTRLWPRLSQELRHNPEMLALRIDHLQEQVLDDRHDIDALLTAQMENKIEASHRHDYDITTPWGKIPLQIAIIVALALLIVRPDLLAKWMP